MPARATVDEVHRVISAAVDGDFYRAVYPDLREPGLDPVGHYVAQGWREGRDPAPWFSSVAYVRANEDVRRSGSEPLYHYLTIGRREGREVWPSPHGELYHRDRARRGAPSAWRFEPASVLPSATDDRAFAAGPLGLASEAPADGAEASPASATHEQEMALVATEFDREFYLEANGDVAAAGQDPLEHFVVTGWREGRDPNPRFSVREYLEAYPDIVAAGINPFYHYLLAGRAEGRHARAPVGFRYHTLAALTPVADRVAALKGARATVKPLPGEALEAALGQSRTGLRDLHVTFSHDDYTTNLGGLQLCLQREDARIADLGRDHLHLHPALHWPVVRQSGERGHLGVVWNGRPVGVFEPKVIRDVLKRAAAAVPARQRSFAVHSLLGHSADDTVALLRAVGLKAGYFWLHDFASLCAGYHLLRNDVEDCAAPPPDSPACSICSYLPMRQRHLTEHGRLFEALDLTVVAPSASALELWRASWSYPSKGEVVLPHARLVDRGAAPVRKGAFRLAYAGMPAVHKGWQVFQELAFEFAGDDRYEFLHLGARKASGVPVAFHSVAATAERPQLMQETLEALRVDAVLVWPLCRETFSFTAYESVAAGCAVVTNPDSGNVAAFVTGEGHGRVLAGEAVLREALASGTMAALSRAKRKPRLYDLEYSGLTVDLIAPRAQP
jgi:hypothetical protein